MVQAMHAQCVAVRAHTTSIILRVRAAMVDRIGSNDCACLRATSHGKTADSPIPSMAACIALPTTRDTTMLPPNGSRCWKSGPKMRSRSRYSHANIKTRKLPDMTPGYTHPKSGPAFHTPMTCMPKLGQQDVVCQPHPGSCAVWNVKTPMPRACAAALANMLSSCQAKSDHFNLSNQYSITIGANAVANIAAGRTMTRVVASTAAVAAILTARVTAPNTPRLLTKSKGVPIARVSALR